MTQSNVTDTLAKSKFKLQLRAIPLINLKYTDQGVLRNQLFGSTASMASIDVMREYAKYCTLNNNDSHAPHPDRLRRAMDGVKKFLDENGKVDPITNWWEPAYPELIRDAEISEPVWDALVAIRKLYQNDFSDFDKKICSVKIRKFLKIIRLFTFVKTYPTTEGRRIFLNIYFKHALIILNLSSIL